MTPRSCDNTVSKHDLTGEISSRRARLAEIDYNLARFSQLSDVYLSDIARLETLEEAGFMLVVGSDRDCPLCGAPASAQSHQHGVEEIELVQQAAIAEIAKISHQQRELKSTIDQLNAEMQESQTALAKQEVELETVEADFRRLAPEVDKHQRQLNDLLSCVTTSSGGSP
jgi:DNA repair exonuclease SbcCD ATPase subunit